MPINLRRDVHVADRHPGAAETAAHQVFRAQGQDRHHGEREQVFRGGRRARSRHHDAEEGARRDGDLSGGAVVAQPAPFVEQPHQKELRRERRDREIESLDAQARQPEQHAHGGGDEARQQKHDDQIELRYRRHQLEGRVGAHPHEGPGPERELAAIAGEDVEPERGEAEHEEGQQDGVERIGGDEERHDQEGREQHRDDEPAILRDREDRLVGGVGRLELTDLAVKHRLSS